MKKTIRLLAALLLCSLSVMMLVSCSTFGSIKSRFEKDGYTYLAPEDEDGKKQAATITAELEEGDVSCTTHVFHKSLAFAIVFEFGSDKEVTKALAESETLKGLVKDAQNSDYVNGNCILFPIALGSERDSMIKNFKGK